MPVVAVEIEVSLKAYRRETKDGKQLQLFPFQSGQLHLYSWFSDCHLQRAWDKRHRVLVSASRLVTRITSCSTPTGRSVVDCSLMM